MAGCGDDCGVDAAHANRHERRILVVVLLLNAGMFVAEFAAGLFSGSTALLADSLDMLADALGYALGLYALGRAARWRSRAALASGIFQSLLGFGVALEALGKTLAAAVPDVATMGVFGVLAGVLLAAALVTWLDSPVPDIVIGLFIAAVVIRSAWRITVEAAAQHWQRQCRRCRVSTASGYRQPRRRYPAAAQTAIGFPDVRVRYLSLDKSGCRVYKNFRGRDVSAALPA